MPFGPSETIRDAVKKLLEQKEGFVVFDDGKDDEYVQYSLEPRGLMFNWPTMLNSKIAWLSNVVDSADAAPTRQAQELFAELKARTDAQIGPWKEALAKDVSALNELMRKEGIPAVGLATAR